MTATAQSAEEEFKHFYGLDVVVIPPNTSCIRIDHKDVIFKTKKEKNRALLNEIIKTTQTRRPILVGTSSVKESTFLAKNLQRHNIKCDVLNAKRDEAEAGVCQASCRLN